MFDFDDIEEEDPVEVPEEPAEVAGRGGALLWEVLSSGPAVGLMVRKGKDMTSEECKGGRLALGSVVAELELDEVQDRMRYTLLVGSGPKDGWVSTKLKGKTVMLPAGEAGTTVTKESVEQEASKSEAIWIFTEGSRGDIQPMVSLALGFKQAGYRTRVLGPLGFAKAFALGQGIEYTEFGSNEDGVSDETLGLSEAAILAAKESSETAGDGACASDSMAILLDNVNQRFDEMYERIKERMIRHGDDPDYMRNDDLITDSKVERNKGLGITKEIHSWHDCQDAAAIECGEAQQKLQAYQINEALKKESPSCCFYGNMVSCPVYLIWKKTGCKMVKLDFYPDIWWWLDAEGKAKEFEDPKGRWQLFAKYTADVTGVNPLEGVPGKEFVEFGQQMPLVLCAKDVIELFPGLKDEQKKYWLTHTAMDGAIILPLLNQLSSKDCSFFGGHDNLLKMQNFLDAGPPPFYIGWGSMPVTTNNLAKFIMCLLVLGQMGYGKIRIIIVRGWSSNTKEGVIDIFKGNDPDDRAGIKDYLEKYTCWVDVAPHDWLFPRCVCNIHHGGNGTTMAALRAGVPNIITPYGWWDQVTYAKWIVKNGWGAHLSMVKNMFLFNDPEWIDTLRKCYVDKKMKAVCKENGEKLRGQNIIGDIIKRTEQMWEREKQSPSELIDGRRPFGR